jgi:hypothetical protein
MAAFAAEIEDKIARYGWVLQGVLPDRKGEYGWSYTVGLEDRDLPELIVTGLPPQTAHTIISRIIRDCDEGRRAWPSAGDTLGGVLMGDHLLRVVAVEPDIAQAGEWFAVAHARRASRVGLTALQIVWPNEDDSWPEGPTEAQPLLGTVWW